MPRTLPVPERLSQLLWSSFLRSGGVVIPAAGTAITLLAWILKTTATVPIVPLVIVATFVCTVLATCIHAATVAHAAATKRLPAVRLATTTSAHGVRGILLLDSSDLFIVDAAVS